MRLIDCSSPIQIEAWRYTDAVYGTEVSDARFLRRAQHAGRTPLLRRAVVRATRQVCAAFVSASVRACVNVSMFVSVNGDPRRDRGACRQIRSRVRTGSDVEYTIQTQNPAERRQRGCRADRRTATRATIRKHDAFDGKGRFAAGRIQHGLSAAAPNVCNTRRDCFSGLK